MKSTMSDYDTFDEWAANAPEAEVKEYLDEIEADEVLASEWYHI